MHILPAFILSFLQLFLGSPSSQVKSATVFSQTLSVNYANWSQEVSGSLEKITKVTNGWIMTAGGSTATTHYARFKLKLPEKLGIVSTDFYMKANVNFPSDFFTTQQKASMRLMTTDNYGTKLGATFVGTTTPDELRTAVYIDSTHHWRILATHENHPTKTLWLSTVAIPTGSHTLEFAGSVSEVKPWYFKVDGKVLASSIDRLSPDTVPAAERVITRFVVGIDGAAEQSANSMSYTLNDFFVSDVDPNQLTPTLTPAPTVAMTDNVAPTLVVTSPKVGGVVTKNILFSASAQDTSGIATMEIWFDKKLVKTYLNTSSFSHTQTFKNLASGSHIVTIYATDKSALKNKAKVEFTVVK